MLEMALMDKSKITPMICHASPSLLHSRGIELKGENLILYNIVVNSSYATILLHVSSFVDDTLFGLSLLRDWLQLKSDGSSFGILSHHISNTVCIFLLEPVSG